MLDAPTDAPLLLLERTFFARDGAALRHAHVYWRPDSHRQIIEFRSSGATREEA
jgi:DNA-binding GntR family transcriptional regulator